MRHEEEGWEQEDCHRTAVRLATCLQAVNMGNKLVNALWVSLIGLQYSMYTANGLRVAAKPSLPRGHIGDVLAV